jgi:hypothetical protein
MGYGSATGGDGWQFSADGVNTSSSRITGYLGRAGEFVGCIAFYTGSCGVPSEQVDLTA